MERYTSKAGYSDSMSDKDNPYWIRTNCIWDRHLQIYVDKYGEHLCWIHTTCPDDIKVVSNSYNFQLINEIINLNEISGEYDEMLMRYTDIELVLKSTSYKL